LASSNPGKVREFNQLAAESPTQGFEIAALPDFAKYPIYEETASTFAENAAGKALHYSQFTDEAVLADDSGLVVPALGGAPGVHSARYAGPGASDADRVAKLLREMKDMTGDARRAHFICVIVVAKQGRALAVVSDAAEGSIIDAPRGENGFGYDPVFLFPEIGKTYAESSNSEKNRLSHRGKAFRKTMYVLSARNTVTF
jgi:non-canonical purine NTP pyrophosphatase (RdgB/HAM1 family)